MLQRWFCKFALNFTTGAGVVLTIFSCTRGTWHEIHSQNLPDLIACTPNYKYLIPVELPRCRIGRAAAEKTNFGIKVRQLPLDLKLSTNQTNIWDSLAVHRLKLHYSDRADAVLTNWSKISPAWYDSIESTQKWPTFMWHFHLIQLIKFFIFFHLQTVSDILSRL